MVTPNKVISVQQSDSQSRSGCRSCRTVYGAQTVWAREVSQHDELDYHIPAGFRGSLIQRGGDTARSVHRRL